ncbi:MAG: 1-deoxy-D-xylulose-5-phosphate synthase [Planctomycetota bacterium]|nr:1-deoxy-D-xylulose-5-phosphate synthase [Planctomycetota bacterium]
MEFKHLPTIKTPRDLKKLSIDELVELAAELRYAICEQVSRSGGHLAPNLGVVELTIAMHYVFDFESDRLLFDVGHQCYPHKLLTGRHDMLDRLRMRGGMAGFPEPLESPFDLFSVGHAGTAISTAVGMARGDELNGESFSESNPDGRRVVSLIGDASIVNGLAMEGLNNAGTLKRQFLVVLNDNGMSIAKPQGAVAQYFDRVRLSDTYSGFRKAAKEIAKHIPGGGLAADLYHRMGEASKAMLAEDTWFEKFGLVTVGPIDGHDLPTLIEFLNEAKRFERPMVLHVKTIKGKGFDFAEGNATQFHSPPAFDVSDTGAEATSQEITSSCRVELKRSGRSFTSAFSDALADVMESDDKAVACTAAMPDGTGLTRIMEQWPERSWDTGICESHAMDMMAGLAKTGLKPFFAVYSTFLQRAFDQAFQEVALQGHAVRLCLDRAGCVGGDGAVHQGFCDISLLAVLPHAALLAPVDESSLKAGMAFMTDYAEGLSAIRYPRDNVSALVEDRFGPAPPFKLGRSRCLIRHDQPDVAVISYGTCGINAIEAADQLANEFAVEVHDGRFAKPVDLDLLKRLVAAGTPVITVEDHGLAGGFGAQVVDACNQAGLDTSLITRLGMPERWIRQGSRSEQLAEVGIDTDGIVRAIRNVCSSRADRGTTAPVVEKANA